MTILNCKIVLRRFLLFNCIFNNRGKFSLRGSIITVSFTLLFPITNFLGARIDNTLYLAGNGKGLMQHYGVWAMFITTPIVIIISSIVVQKYLSILSNLKQFTKDLEIPNDLQCMINKHIRSLSLKYHTKYLLILFMIVGLMFSIVNVIQTINPIGVYGNDVYDSLKYPWGYIANKFHLLILWSIIYPIIFFIIIHIFVSMIMILKSMKSRKLFVLDLFNEDGCGGVSDFGKLNFLISIAYLNIFVVIFAVKLTHYSSYFTVIFPLVLFSLFFIVHSFIGVYQLHILIKNDKKNMLIKVNKELNVGIYNLNQFSQELLHLREYLLTISTYPYTKATQRLIRIISFTPTLIIIVKSLKDYFHIFV